MLDFHGSVVKSLHSFLTHFWLPKPGCLCHLFLGSSWPSRHELLSQLKLISDSFYMPGPPSRVYYVSAKKQWGKKAHLFVDISPIYGLSIIGYNSHSWPLLRTPYWQCAMAISTYHEKQLPCYQVCKETSSKEIIRGDSLSSFSYEFFCSSSICELLWHKSFSIINFSHSSHHPGEDAKHLFVLSH